MKETQEQWVLRKLKDAKGGWVNGNEVFLREMFLTQYHRAIWNLQHHPERYECEGKVEASIFTDRHGFKSYRLVPPHTSLKVEDVGNGIEF